MLIEFAVKATYFLITHRARAPGELRGTPGSHLKPISAQINNQIMKIEEERDRENPSQLTRASRAKKLSPGFAGRRGGRIAEEEAIRRFSAFSSSEKIELLNQLFHLL